MYTAFNRIVPIPLKGALAHGKVTYDLQKQLFFGQAIIDAYLLEENVHFYGIVVHHTAERFVTDKLVESLFQDTKVPLKSGLIEH